MSATDPDSENTCPSVFACGRMLIRIHLQEPSGWQRAIWHVLGDRVSMAAFAADVSCAQDASLNLRRICLRAGLLVESARLRILSAFFEQVPVLLGRCQRQRPMRGGAGIVSIRLPDAEQMENICEASKDISEFLAHTGRHPIRRPQIAVRCPSVTACELVALRLCGISRPRRSWQISTKIDLRQPFSTYITNFLVVHRLKGVLLTMS